MIKTIFWIWPHHHVGLVGDHPEAQLVELLHQLQQLVILPANTKDLIAFISYSYSKNYLGFDLLFATCNSMAI